MRKTVLVSLLGLGLCLPVIASASTLVIDNHSTRDSTLKVTNGTNTACSSKLLTNGVTKANNGHTEVSEGNMNMLCGANKDNCLADIYMTNDCSGPVIAKAKFSTTRGIQDLKEQGDTPFTFTFTTGGFYMLIEGGPVAAK